MKGTAYLAAVLLLSGCNLAHGDEPLWQEEGKCYVPGPADKFPIRFRFTERPPEGWHFMDLTREAGIPTSAVSADLQGVAIITDPSPGKMCHIRMETKHPGAPRVTPIDSNGAGRGAWNGFCQTLTVNELGSRSGCSFVVPLGNGGFDYYYDVDWSPGCTVAITVWVGRWCDAPE